MTKPRNIILAAAFFYVFLAPFFFHPDIKIIFYLSQFLSQGVINIYHYIAVHPELSTHGSFVYPPLAYFFFGTIFPVLKWLAGSGFTDWLGMGNDAVAVPHLFRYLFLLKLPVIAAHLAVGYCLSRLISQPRRQSLALLVWFFNPISIYTVAFMGQIDVLPVLATVLALLWIKDRPYLSVFLLGLGAAFKTYPLLLLPFAALLAARRFRHSLLLLATGLLPYLLFISPYLLTPAFYTDTLTSGLSQRILQIGLPIGSGESLLLVPVFLLFLLLTAAYLHRGQSHRFAAYCLAVTLIPIASSHFHPQWVLWSLPFVSLFLATQSFWSVALLFFGSFIGIIGLFPDKFLTWGLLSPLEPEILFLPSLVSLLPPVPVLLDLLHTIFFAASVWMVWRFFLTSHE